MSEKKNTDGVQNIENTVQTDGSYGDVVVENNEPSLDTLNMEEILRVS